MRPASPAVPRIPVSRAVVAGAGMLVLMLAPAESRAQSEASFGAFMSSAPTARIGDPAPTLAGVTLGFYGGQFGLRGSGGVWLETQEAATANATTVSVNQWGVDGDAVLRLSPWNMASPYGFIGIGAVGRNDTDYDDAGDAVTRRTTQQTWSYGGGMSVRPVRALELSGEARYRRPIVSEGATPSMQSRMEYRAGLAIFFGGPRGRYHGGGYGSTKAPVPKTPGGRITITPAPARAPVVVSGGRARVIPTAEKYLGTKYRYGGSSPSTGFDCSGFVQYVYAKHGVTLPRTSRAMAKVGTPLRADFRSLAAGDLVMFAQDGGVINHVAVYAGDRRIIHASSSGGAVRYDDLDTERGQWFVKRLVAARRVTPDGKGVVRDLTKALQGTGLLELPLDAPDFAPSVGSY
jgi:hypothetical protein